jgi:UDP-2,3-diacylglucosamine pyrophosphatase LpxH
MAAVQRLIIADSHVGQGVDDVPAMQILVRRAAERGVGEIIYLGDAFQYLIGISKFWTTSVREVLEVWREVRERGLRIGIVEGNRDFFLDESDLASELDWASRRYDFNAGRKLYRLVHGDLVNRRDLQYRFWSTVSKSAPARVWARLLPRGLAVAIVRRMEAHLATTNRRFRYAIPKRDLVRSAAAAWHEGVDVLLWGHFHARWVIEEGHRLAMVLPGWLETRTSLMVDPSGRWALVDCDLKETELDASSGRRATPAGSSP